MAILTCADQVPWCHRRPSRALDRTGSQESWRSREDFFCDQIKPEWDCQSFYIIIRLSSRSVPPIGTQHETRHLCQALARARSRSPTHHPPRRTSRSVPSRLRLASDCAIASVIAAMRGYYIIAPGTDRCIRKSNIARRQTASASRTPRLARERQLFEPPTGLLTLNTI